MKDSKITFADGRDPYEFSSETPLSLILKTAKERKWPIDAIHTPDYVLVVLEPETYENAVSNWTLSQDGVK